MTLTEKILARAAGKTRVQAGDNLWVNADVLMTHDVCGPGTIGVFKREFGQTAKVWDRDRVVSTSAFTHTLSPGCTRALPAARARIVSVSVIKSKV